MRVIRGQVLASTREDSHGERYDRLFLEDLVASMPGSVLLQDNHDLGKPPVGRVENARVAALQDHPGEWAVVADVTFFDEKRADIGGFSWSSLQPIRANADAPAICLYLPWPYYKREDYIDWFLDQPSPVRAGKWIKKSADPTLISLVACYVVLRVCDSLISEIVADVYPKIRDQIPKLKRLWREGFRTDFGLKVLRSDGGECKLILATDGDHQEACASEEAIHQAIACATEKLLQIEAEGKTPTRITLAYYPRSRSYQVVSATMEGGDSIHFAPGSD